MKTIPAAMTWELLARGRWSILAALLGAIAFPAILLAALNSDGGVDAQDPAMLLMHLILTQVGMFLIAAAVFSAQGPISRLYPYPVRTSTLVAWRMAPAMAIVAIVSVAVTAAINAIFSLGWPLWSTAFFLAVAAAAVQAATSLTEKSAWVVFALTVVATAWGLWLKSRYGPMFDDPTHMWTFVTPFEAFTMLTAAAVAYAVAIFGVARNRRGEPPFSLGVIKWIGSFFTEAPAQFRRFPTPYRAQLWCEWQSKGWIMPLAVVVVLFVGLVVWLFSSRNAHELVHGLVFAGGILTVIGFLGGLILGNNGQKDDDFAMSTFLAARPMTDSDLARIVLHTGTRSLLVAWLIWAAAFAAVLAIVGATGALPHPIVPKELGWWYLPATILGPWITIALCMTAGLTGRMKTFVQLVCILAGGYIVLTVISKLMLTPRGQTQLEYVMAAAAGLTLTLGTMGLYAKARRRHMIPTSTLVAAAFAWLAATAILLTQWPPPGGHPPLPAYALLTGLLAAAIAPFAAAPLAIAWNRHR